MPTFVEKKVQLRNTLCDALEESNSLHMPEFRMEHVGRVDQYVSDYVQFFTEATVDELLIDDGKQVQLVDKLIRQFTSRTIYDHENALISFEELELSDIQVDIQLRDRFKVLAPVILHTCFAAANYQGKISSIRQKFNCSEEEAQQYYESALKGLIEGVGFEALIQRANFKPPHSNFSAALVRTAYELVYREEQPEAHSLEQKAQRLGKSFAKDKHLKPLIQYEHSNNRGNVLRITDIIERMNKIHDKQFPTRSNQLLHGGNAPAYSHFVANHLMQSQHQQPNASDNHTSSKSDTIKPVVKGGTIGGVAGLVVGAIISAILLNPLPLLLGVLGLCGGGILGKAYDQNSTSKTHSTTSSSSQAKPIVNDVLQAPDIGNHTSRYWQHHARTRPGGHVRSC